MFSTRIAVLTLGALIVGAAPAFADLTAFIGANTTPANRRVQGFAVGAGLLLLGFEFEYANTPESDQPAGADAAPALRTGMGNLLVQTPFAILGVQPYATAGGGLYRERLAAHEQNGFAVNMGAGVKVNLLGPLRLRIDYRVLRLGNGALYSPAHRVYAGVNLKF